MIRDSRHAEKIRKQSGMRSRKLSVRRALEKLVLLTQRALERKKRKEKKKEKKGRKKEKRKREQEIT